MLASIPSQATGQSPLLFHSACLAKRATLPNLLQARSRDEQDLTLGLASFQVAVRLGGSRERKAPIDARLQLAILDPSKQLARAPEQLLSGGDVMDERRT